MSEQETGTEKRRFHRVPFKSNIELKAGQKSWPCELCDVSMNGALIEAPLNFDVSVGDKLTLAIQLDEEETRIDMSMEVAHITDTKIGCKCLEIDAESLTYLRRLLELNLGDANLVYRELAQLGDTRE